MSRYLLIGLKYTPPEQLRGILKKDGCIIMMDTLHECYKYLDSIMQVGDVYSLCCEQIEGQPIIFNYEYRMYQREYEKLLDAGLADTPEAKALEERMKR